MSQLGHLPAVGESVDRYTVLAELAHGGMAAVYAVGRKAGNFDKIFAMKVMLPHLVSQDRFVDMFMDEARIAAHVQHPNVVQVFDVGEHRRTPFLVMEYLRGQSLSAIRRRTELPTGAVLEILAGAAEGLHAAHETRDSAGTALQIVHRDISPHNIHVSYDGTVKVVDFGIAAAEGRITQTRTGEVKGKFGYAAPEQLRPGRTIDRRLDLWALGVVAHELLTGQRLFRGETDADTMFNVLKKDIPRLSDLVPELPSGAHEILESCLERTVELRPANALVVARALRNAAQEMDAPDEVGIGALIAAAFVEERAVEEDRIAMAVGTAPAATREDESSSGRAHVHATNADGVMVPMDTMVTAPPAPSPRRWLIGVATLFLAMGLGAALLFADGGDELAPVAVDTAPVEEPPEEPTSAPSPPAATPIAGEEPEPGAVDVAHVEPAEEIAVPTAASMATSMARRRRRRGMRATPMAEMAETTARTQMAEPMSEAERLAAEIIPLRVSMSSSP